MLFLVEGPDCGGKSTLARRLAAYLRAQDPEANVRTIHRGPPDSHPLVEYAEQLLSYRPGQRRHIICDRWHLGELVYPLAVGRPSELTSGVLAWLELFLASRGAYLITTHATDEYLLDCGRSRNDPAVELERVSETNRLFEFAYRASTLPSTAVLAGDVTHVDVESIVDEARLIDHRAAVIFDHGTRATTYVGPPRPSLLLVGDRRGVAGSPTDYGDWPAFAPYGSTSGAYLMTVLTSVQLRVPSHGHLLSTLALVNANDVDDVRLIWENVGRPSVVALGVDASRKLRDVEVPYRKVPHPQYWRRFRHSEQSTYLKRLLNLDVFAEVTR